MVSYGSEEAWELQGQDVKIDIEHIEVSIVGNDFLGGDSQQSSACAILTVHRDLNL